MPSIPFAALDFDCVMTTDGELPPYKGSMLRGGLGHGLRRACCAVRGRECAGCPLAAACLFPRLFHPSGTGGRQLPPPYCLVPPEGGKTSYSGGESLSFRLKLFSYAVEFAPYYVLAVSLMGRAGVGRGTAEGHGKFCIRDISCGGVRVYEAAQEKLLPLPQGQLAMPETWRPSEERFSLEIELATPCRFKQEQQLSGTLDFAGVIMLALRRAKGLCQMEGLRYSLDRFQDFMQLAQSVRTVQSSLWWKDWSRWSSRQQESMRLGGLTGRIAFEGRLAPFMPFLEFARQAHIGKQTAFGLGQVKIGTPDAAWTPPAGGAEA